MKIKMTMKAIDGVAINKTFKTLKGARKFATDWLGSTYDVGNSYAVSGDGISTIYCTGCTLKELLDLEKETKAVPNNNHKNGEEKMTGLKMTENFIVGSRDGVLYVGALKKAKPAKPATEAVEGIKAVAAVEAVAAVKADKEKGIKAVKAVAAAEGVKGVKAVPASPAIEATPAVQQVHLDLVSQEVANEVKARMADQGFTDKFPDQTIMNGKAFRLTYEAENDKIIRAAFKKCKSKDGYNAPGLAAKSEIAKAAAKAEKEKAAAEKEKAAAAKAAAEKEVTEVVEKPVDENGVTDEWPED